MHEIELFRSTLSSSTRDISPPFVPEQRKQNWVAIRTSAIAESGDGVIC